MEGNRGFGWGKEMKPDCGRVTSPLARTQHLLILSPRDFHCTWNLYMSVSARLHISDSIHVLKAEQRLG